MQREYYQTVKYLSNGTKKELRYGFGEKYRSLYENEAHAKRWKTPEGKPLSFLWLRFFFLFFFPQFPHGESVRYRDRFPYPI